ncbi:4-phosphopantetheinyl transferase [Methylobacterium radiotolerans]|uniref:4'-phosphopantetheinyl transferase family protein n=1 Tax=Methylobacterium TaxID=407 RepID=UPI002F2F4A32
MSAAQVWIVDLALSRDRIERCDRVLDAAERARAHRFLRPADRARFRASHAALRLILADALGVAPADVEFAVGPGGKPELAGAARGAADFNLSHSGARALIGLARDAAIGVDVEAVRPIPDALRIAAAHFAADEVSTLARAHRNALAHSFFGLWTRKEAVVKALGSGLSLPLDRFSVSVPPEPPRLMRAAGDASWNLNGPWSLEEVDCGAAHVATVAVRSADADITRHRLADDWPDHLG